MCFLWSAQNIEHIRCVFYESLNQTVYLVLGCVSSESLAVFLPRIEWPTTQSAPTYVTPIFPKKTKCKPICMPGSSFMHIVTYKCIQKQYHVKKEKDYQRFTLNPGNEGSKLHRQSTGGCVRLAPATSSQDFRIASSFWATLFIAWVSTCRTQQVWGKNECKGFIVDWALSI
jgi:hypothetical protein